MNSKAAHDEGSPRSGESLRTTLKLLKVSTARLRDASDLAGLELVETEAKALAAESSGRTRKHAERIAQEASLAVVGLRQLGLETNETNETNEAREAREAREVRQARWEAQEIHTRLFERLVSLLHLLLKDGTPPGEGVGVLSGLATTNGDGRVRIEIPAALASSSSSLLIGGYDGSRRIFSELSPNLEKTRPTIERTLKTVAVGLMTAGAEVRGLTADAVPLVAYSLFSGRLPDAVDPATSSGPEKVDDLLLNIADEVSAMPADTRPLFIGLFRLAMLLGEAQAYAEKVSLTSLSFS